MFNNTSAAHQVSYLVFDGNADIDRHVRVCTYRSHDVRPECYAGITLDNDTKVEIDDQDVNGHAHISVTMSIADSPAWYHAVLPAYDDTARATAARVLVELIRSVLDSDIDDIDDIDDIEYDDEYDDDE